MSKAFRISDYLSEQEPRTMEVTLVRFERIFQNWRNFYAVDNNKEDLAESIKVSGLLTPLGVVREGVAGDRYKLISGHRRWRAIRYLRDSEPDGRKTWELVPCVVYDTPEDADREQLMLIHANSQRVKTGQEIAREARETLEILQRMKESGVELPGRMRDRVAEALQVSSTRLARLDAIEKNLTYPGWARKWKENKINEAVAYRLSQLDYSQQMNAADWVIAHNIKDGEITVKHIEEALAHPPLTNPGCADPLFYEEDTVKVDRELVRRMGNVAGRLRNLGPVANRKDGMDRLKKEYRYSGLHGGDLEYDGEPKGLRFTKPIEWLLGWGAMYDALAANALDAAIARATETPAPKKEAAASDDAPTSDDGISHQAAAWFENGRAGWRRCLKDDPEHGQLVAVLDPTDAHLLEVYRFLDGFYTEIDDPEDTQPVKPWMWWTPLAELPEAQHEQ